MIEAAIDALVDTAADGVSFDGLDAAETADGYRMAVLDETHTGLDEPAFRAIARANDAHVLEWYLWHQRMPQAPASWDFCRWIEGAENRSVTDRLDALRHGVTEKWGQLHITVRADDSHRRRYVVRHTDDATVSRARLSVYREPTAVRDHTRLDDDGAYRPLSTAPTLPTGWVAVELDPAALIETVDEVYPATVANWHLDRADRLDITHWRETADRQTGIYAVVDELDGDRVSWLAEACCADTECLKRREWDETADERLNVARGAGEFPCREPCSLVVAAAREIALAERESADGGLSDPERAQIDRIVTAAAEGESIRIGDVGDGANRLRVRYLRAKYAGADGGMRLLD